MPRAFALYQGFNEDLGVRDIGSAVARARCPSSRAAARWATPGRQAGLSGGLAAATWTWPWATTASASRTAWRSVQAARPAGAAHRRARRLLSSRGARAHPGGAGRQARRGAVRVSGPGPRLRPHRRARTTTSRRDDGAPAQHGGPATRDRAGVRLLHLGQALRIRIRHPRRGRHHGHHGGRALCRTTSHHDRRRGPQGAVALLPASFRQQQSARHAAGAAVAHRGATQIVDELLFCHPHHRDRLDAAACRPPASTSRSRWWRS